jgi:hypothetical protein
MPAQEKAPVVDTGVKPVIDFNGSVKCGLEGVLGRANECRDNKNRGGKEINCLWCPRCPALAIPLLNETP